MDRRGQFGAADEHPLGRTHVDEDEVTGGKRVAVLLVFVDSPHAGTQ
jgi:hypothetical protein